MRAQTETADKLVLVEGFLGSGKSTTAQWLTTLPILLNRGRGFSDHI